METKGLQGDEKIQQSRYWNLYREAVEAFVKAQEENKNGTLIHSLERLVRIRERDLDAHEKNAKKAATTEGGTMVSIQKYKNEIMTFDMGRHWPETDGDYRAWYMKMRAKFENKYIYIGEVVYSTNSGGMGVLFDGIPKARYEALENGRACHLCAYIVFDEADETAAHLIDAHKWDYETARLWLREKVEKRAFYDEA